MPQLLPTSGWSGSLEKRLIDGGGAFRVWAKTGSLDFASTLAGYLLTDGGLRIFVVMLADERARMRYDALSEPTPAMRQAAAAWEKKAKTLQDELMLGWLRQSR